MILRLLLESVRLTVSPFYICFGIFCLFLQMRWWALLLALVPLVWGQEGLRSETFDGKLQSGAEGSKDADTAVGESQRHEQFVAPPKGFLSPLASSPAFENLGGFMEDHRRDRQIFGFTEEGPIPVRSLAEEVKPVRRERMTTIVEDGVKLVPTLHGQVNQFSMVLVIFQ